MIQDQFASASPSWLFWSMWGLAFLGFPIGGLLASLIVGPVSGPVPAVLAGAITGAVLGLAQWLVLRTRYPLPISWVIATSVGMAVGLALSTSALGSETGDNNLVWRGLMTGLVIGIAQAVVFRFGLSFATSQVIVWAVVVGLAWAIGWFITRSVGVNLSPKFTVFGSTGAWAFQFFTGLTIYFVLRLPQAIQGMK